MSIDIVAEPQAWIEAWRDHLNGSERFAETGAGWGVDFDGSVLFVVQPDDYLDEPICFHVEPYDGAVGEARYVTDLDGVEYGFSFAGEYVAWKALTRGDVDPVEAVMNGTFSFDGDMTTLLTYTDAASAMIGAASAVDTEFPY
jgi:putative sterol carrier protein